MSQKLPGTGLGQPHEVLDLDVMIEFGLFVRGKRVALLALDQVPYALVCIFGRPELNNLPRTQRGDEFNEFFVGFHFLSFGISLASAESKPLKTLDLVRIFALYQTPMPRARLREPAR